MPRKTIIILYTHLHLSTHIHAPIHTHTLDYYSVYYYDTMQMLIYLKNLKESLVFQKTVHQYVVKQES